MRSLSTVKEGLDRLQSVTFALDDTAKTLSEAWSELAALKAHVRRLEATRSPSGWLRLRAAKTPARAWRSGVGALSGDRSAPMMFPVRVERTERDAADAAGADYQPAATIRTLPM